MNLIQTLEAEAIEAFKASKTIPDFRAGDTIRVGGGYVTQSPVPGSRYQSFGLMQGSADLIGWTEVTVTPEMVGQSVAVFTSIEVKTATGRARKNQERWATYVKKSGGLAGFARDEQEARRIISGRK